MKPSLKDPAPTGAHRLRPRVLGCLWWKEEVMVFQQEYRALATVRVGGQVDSFYIKFWRDVTPEEFLKQYSGCLPYNAD